MSVWESTTYKLEMARAIYCFFPDGPEAIFGNSIGGYLSPKGELHDLDATDSWDDLADKLGWEKEDLDESTVKKIRKLVTGVKKWTVGVHGVYTLIHAVRHGYFSVKDQYNYALIDRRCRALETVLAASTMITPAAFSTKWRQCDRSVLALSRRFENASEGWKYLVRDIDTRNVEFTRFEQVKYFGDGDRVYYGGHIRNLIIMRGSGSYTERGIIMTRKHVDLLIGASLRVAGILDYMAREYADDFDVMRRMRTMLDMTIDTAARCSRVNADKIVQAYHKARSYMQMRMFENQMEDALEESIAEFQKKNLQTMMNLTAYVKLFHGLAKGRWLDLFHIYKWMPPPDYDATYAFQELYEHHMSTRLSGLDTNATAQMKEFWPLIVRERKLNIASTYHKIYKRWPTGLAMVDGFPSEETIDAWDPRGLFPYYTYGKDVTAQIKDKATVLARMGDEISQEKKVPSQNFLLWYLLNHNTIDTVKIARQVQARTLPEDNYVRVAYKGEAHKPGSRLFFMAPPLQRLVLGELEGNISRIASEYPASLQGVDSLTRAHRLEKLFSLDRTSFAVEPEDVYTGYIITFDLSKFSPKFNPAVLQDLHRFWANVFEYEPISAYGRLGAESVILHTTNGLVMSYQNEGADLEGFRGRMMTLFHADLIATACRYAKSKGYLIGKSHSAVFIDDGAVKIAAAGTGLTAKKNALQFLKCMQLVYAAAGQENHPNKTIVSAIGGELLSEQYLYGQRLKCAVKAGMRLFPPYEIPAASITEEFDAIFSTTQGSVKDGGDWVIAYRKLAEAYMKCLNRWCRHEFRYLQDVPFAFKLVTPKSMGGFGFPSLQALTTTTAYDLTVEGLGILNSAARAYREYEPEVAKIVGRSVVTRSALQVLRDPSRVRLVGPILVEGRMNNKIVKRLRERTGPWSGHLGLVRDEDLVDHATAVAEALMSQQIVSIPVMKRAWDSLPLSYVEGLVLKFQRSASVQTMLRENEIRAIRRANQKDVATLLRTYF